MEEPFGGRRFVADTSAWARRDDPRVAAEWQAAISARQLLITPVVELEMLYSAREGNDIEWWRTRFAELREAPLTPSAIRAAGTTISELALEGPQHHRVPVADLLIAAAGGCTRRGRRLTTFHFRGANERPRKLWRRWAIKR